MIILSLNKTFQWMQNNILPDTGINNNFFHNFKFHVLQSSDEWLRVFRYSEDITLKTSHWRHSSTKQRCPWKLGLSWGKHTGKHLRCSVILVKLWNLKYLKLWKKLLFIPIYGIIHIATSKNPAVYIQVLIFIQKGPYKWQILF